MKIALITANTGSIDEVKSPVKQSIEYDYFCYTEPPFPLSELVPRMQAKYIKLQHHRFLPGYDVYIWIDGRIEITSPTWVEDIVNKLQGYDIVITKHTERKTVGEEYEFLLWHMGQPSGISSASRYLNSRYNKNALMAESVVIDHSLPLYACGVFAWAPTGRGRVFMESWWRWCIQYGSFDQCAFSHLVTEQATNVLSIDYTGLKVNKHAR